MDDQLSDYSYDLPPGQIARHPAGRRDESRLLRLGRADGRLSDHRFSDLAELLRPGDCLVVNDSRVIPARLAAMRPGGGAAELLLVAPLANGEWEAMVRPGRRLRTGMRLALGGGEGQAEITGGEGRMRRVRLSEPSGVAAFLDRHGRMPLPPYILRQREAHGEPERSAEDRERYQTIYAREEGSIAAPTAGLHFTPELLERLERRGIERRRVTLHVGVGTFEPIEAALLAMHRMHTEYYAIGEEDAAAIEAARQEMGRRIVAVGTTSVRALESCLAASGKIAAGAGQTDLFIRPGHRFGAVDAMVSNFHLPGSTLLVLVAAFAGRERVLEGYRHAVAAGYRFYSYGDAMLIE